VGETSENMRRVRDCKNQDEFDIAVGTEYPKTPGVPLKLYNSEVKHPWRESAEHIIILEWESFYI
jgi:hypothetical protein